MQSRMLHSGGPGQTISRGEQRALLEEAARRASGVRRVLLLPPDFTRFHSGAGEITRQLYDILRGHAEVEIMPAIGTHAPMARSQLHAMFGDIPADRFHVHDWRDGIAALGEVPSELVREVSGDRVTYSITAEVDRLVASGRHDWIVSIGQVVPHEVIGMANHNKNVFVGTGGKDTINKTHFLGAVAGMESIMGRRRSPVRDVLDYAEDQFAGHLPLTYVLTVRAHDGERDELVTRGLFIDDGRDGFAAACSLSQQENITLLDKAPDRVVVYLDPDEYHSTWLGNKAVYRTRMAIADGGELVVLAPGVETFGEDRQIDALIRQFGYRTTPEVLDAVTSSDALRGNLSAAAHLIHGSSEARFDIVYAPGKLDRQAVESVGYRYGELDELLELYRPAALRDGWNEDRRGERFYFIRNPALGLWALRDRFDRPQASA